MVIASVGNVSHPAGRRYAGRFNEPIRRAKATHETSEIGELQALIGSDSLQRMAADSWLTDPARCGGGAIKDHSGHVVGLARCIADEEVAEMYAESGTCLSDIPVEDVVGLSMALENGFPVSHAGSWRQPESWDLWRDGTLRLIRTESVVDCFDQTFMETRDPAGIESIHWGENMNEGLLLDFVDTVR